MDNRTLEEVRKNEDRLINELEQLQQENQSLKKQLEEINYTCVPNSDIKNVIDKYKNQQKEFISYLEKIIKELECDNVDDEEMKGYLIQRKDTFKEILSKYYEIIGGKDEV